MTVNKTILVTGATGYVGGRLVPRLLERGYQVRVLARNPDRLRDCHWYSSVEVVKGDVLQAETLPMALRGIWAAYYLIHSMGASGDFHARDMLAARNFSEAARAEGVSGIVYLGGLGKTDDELSEHLESRHQTGEALREAGVPVTEFRAGMLVGSGSISFDMLRHLTERLPIMVCPRWVFTRTHPIAIRNALDYLLEALEVSDSAGHIIEIGGQNTLTYRDMMLQYAEVRGLRRIIIPVPVLTPRLSSYWVQFVSPVPSSIARPLIEGLRSEMIADTELAQALFPNIQLLDYKTAVSLALQRMATDDVETVWSA